jgi:hypothetical protein
LPYLDVVYYHLALLALNEAVGQPLKMYAIFDTAEIIHLITPTRCKLGSSMKLKYGLEETA